MNIQKYINKNREAIAEHFDEEKHDELMEKESKERRIYIQNLKEFVASLSDKDKD